MKAITIQQPWATLIMIGAKTIETRSWATKYRGPILIHASANIPKFNRELCEKEPFNQYLRQYLADFGPLPTGVILGRAILTDVYHADRLLSFMQFNPNAYPAHEKEFGDYSPGRFGWRLQVMERFAAHVPAKGQLGLWEFPNELLTVKTHP